MNYSVIKKDGRVVDWNDDKIIVAVTKSARRVNYDLTDEDKMTILENVDGILRNYQFNQNKEGNFLVPVSTLHDVVEQALLFLPNVRKSYSDYRDHKKEMAKELDDIYDSIDSSRLTLDRSNANADARLVSTVRFLDGCVLSKKMYRRYNLTDEQKAANDEGYIYIHDLALRPYTFNCCVFNMAEVFRGGFKMGSINYTEPTSFNSCVNLFKDAVLTASSQQYGGFTIPEVDKFFLPYAKMSYKKYYDDYKTIAGDISELSEKEVEEKANAYALAKLRRDLHQGFQGIECMLNSCANAKGDYSFVSITFGLGTDPISIMISEEILKVRMEGQGPKGFKQPVVFPKLIFLYDEKLHGKGKELEDLFNLSILCSSKCMYPDYMPTQNPNPEITEIYEKYGKPLSPMGCRAMVAPFWERGGFSKADENDEPIMIGRFNLGVVSLNLIMIYQKAKVEGKNFYDVLDYYLGIIREIHLQTYEQLSKLPASCDPLAFCEGGLWHGHLKPTDKIKPCLEAATYSFGITGLNELERLHNGHSLVEDGSFALEVIKYIYDKVASFKKKDRKSYALYGTPAESLCGTQVKQFRKKYGVIKNVSDKEYLSNSFHCHVSEDISPIQKQDLEERFWEFFAAGRIQYVRYTKDYNIKAMTDLTRRSIGKKFYNGLNFAKSYCEDCGKEMIDAGDTCPYCGSEHLTTIDRVCGYLSFTRKEGISRMNDAKLAEIRDRKSM